jgi:putative MATE family efflux protein
MTKKAMFAISFTLAGPVFLEEFYGMLLGGILTAIVGNMSTDQLAAFSLATLVQTSSVVMLSVMGIGAAALAAREIGAGNRRLLRQIIGHTIAIGIVGGVLLGLAGYYSAGNLHLIVDVQPGIVLLTEEILRTLFIFTPFQLLMCIGKTILRGMGETRLAFFIGAVGNTTALLVTWLLVFGFHPGFGVYGAIWGTGSGELAGALLALQILSGHAEVGLRPKHITAFNLGTLKRIVRISFPIAWEEIALHTGFVLYSFELVTVGSKQFSANQIAQQLEFVPLIIGVGLGAAVMTIAGQSVGRQLPLLAEKFTRFICGTAIIAMTMTGTLIYLFAEPLVGLFVPDSEVILWTRACLLLSLLEQPTLAAGLILGNALRGAGDTRWPAFSTTIGIWFVRIPLTYLLIDNRAMDITTAWLITAADHLVRCAILLFRFASGGWKKA